MKNFIIIVGLIFSCSSLSAQVDRSIAPSQYKNTTKKNKKVDVIQNSVDFLKAKLDLDGFQEAVVRNLVADNQEKSKEIMDSTTYSDVEKREMIKEIADDFTFKIKKSLSPEQIVKYEKLIKRK